MSYTLGASHTLTGTGSVTIAAPIGLKYTLTVPANLGSLSGWPQELFGAGRITPGNTDGYLPALELRHLAGLFLPIPEGMTLLGHTLTSGVTAVVRELVGTAPAGGPVMPWDRNPVAISRVWAGALTSANCPVTCWTYTVPTGKKLWLSSAHSVVTCDTPSANAGFWLGRITIGSTSLCNAFGVPTVRGQQVRDDVAQGGLILTAGTVVTADVLASQTGSVMNVLNSISGYEFDA